MNHQQFAGKIAVVTGGTQGLGEATARLFAERGAAGLIICGRNIQRGQAIAQELSDKNRRTIFVQADLVQVDDCQTVIAQADSVFGRIDILVNAAGITDRGTILDTSPELFDRMFAINTRAPFLLMQYAAKIMRREKISGAMVNILSMASHGGQPFIFAYSGAKAALATLTKNAAYSLMPDHIRVNGLNIGWMDTPGEDQTQKRFHNADDSWLARAEQSQPFRRLLKPREVAQAIAFLASDESGLMTGAIIDFDQSVNGCYDSPPHPSAL
ncbi:MAG: SDR family oxidoreductase [Chloroflexi bacterium]|nr:SDR family oxidoreductase [Chloroflexota bacterium]